MAFGQQKNPLNNQGIHSAADGNRTRDLRTTNATLYRLSHSSICVSCLSTCTTIHYEVAVVKIIILNNSLEILRVFLRGILRQIR